ncbi:hypothetical protein AgCh_023575 [Apium graveolens]
MWLTEKSNSFLNESDENICSQQVGYVQNRTLKPLLEGKLDREVVAVNEKLLSKSLATIENFWFKVDKLATTARIESATILDHERFNELGFAIVKKKLGKRKASDKFKEDSASWETNVKF